MIRGYKREPEIFHIQRIKNLLVDRISGSKHIPKLIGIMEEDLKKQGIERITASVYFHLAPIAMRRYGFRSPNGLSLDDIKKSWLKFIPYACTPLEKRLS